MASVLTRALLGSCVFGGVLLSTRPSTLYALPSTLYPLPSTLYVRNSRGFVHRPLYASGFGR
jgi:hypothetical protein